MRYGQKTVRELPGKASFVKCDQGIRVYRNVSLLIVFFFIKTHSVGDARWCKYNISGSDGLFGPVVAQNAEVPGLHLGRVGCSSSRLCIYIAYRFVRQTVQRPVVCSAVYGTVHYKEPLKSFDKSRL